MCSQDPFKEYIKQSEPNKRDKGYAWHTEPMRGAPQSDFRM